MIHKEEDYQKVYDIIEKEINYLDSMLIDRVIPQIYSVEMLKRFEKTYEFKNKVFTLYKTDLDEKEIIELVKSNDLNVLTMSEKKYSKALIEELNQLNIKVFLHTINSPELTQKYISDGVYGVYTDFLTYDMFGISQNKNE